jgi:hypothetical protein
LTREWLTSLKRRALRKHAWFRVLKREERGVVDLTIWCVERVKSETLALVLGRIVCKVLTVCRSMFLIWVEKRGHWFAEKLSEVAVSWGCPDAYAWRREPAFIRYLGVTAVNSSTGWNYG